jgi:signal transduction histidine kinase/CheY-like chemotaxis protein/AraC-like DNA-binding protein
MLKILLFLFSLLFSLSLCGQVVTLNPATQYPLTISEQLSTFVDSTSKLTLAEVREKDFSLVGRPYFPLPYSDAAFWFRITLTNQDTLRERWYIEWDNPTVEVAECYRADGLPIPKGQKNVDGESPYFGIDLPQGESQTVYLRIMSQRGYRMTVNLHDESSLRARKVGAAAYFNFTNGMVFLRLFFVLLLAIFAVRDQAFRAYCLMLVLRSLGFWGIQGTMGDFVTDDPDTSTLLDYLSYHFIPIGYVVVVRALLPVERLPKWTRMALSAILVVVLVMGVIILFDYRWYWILASQYFALFAQLLVVGLYLYAVIRRLPINWYYSIPFLLGLSSYCFMVMGDVSIIDAEWVFAAAYFLFLAEIFVFGLFLGKIILDYRRQGEDAQQKMLLKEERAAQLEELDTLKTNFFANISHEFRTPLTMLVGPLEDFRREQPAHPLIPAMQRNVGRLRSLIDQILDLSRLEAGHLRPAIVRADLATFLRQLVASFESMAQSRTIIFNHEQNLDHCDAYFDPDKLEKIVSNLLSNAFKFTPEGGRVSVRVSFAESDLTLVVRDYGIGIEESRLPHIFNRFYRVESKGNYVAEGAGIGLALVHELVRVLQGDIRVVSEPDRGSTFTLRLPTDARTWQEYLTDHKVPDFAPPAAAVPHISDTDHAPAPPVAAEVPLLLIVEDNPDLRAYMRGIFRESYRIVEATDGQNGLDSAFEEIPDLAICDVMMPRLDGFGFCKKLKTDDRTSHIPVVMLTARAALEDRLEGLELGADDYLTKPFNRTELELRVQNLLKQRDLLRQKYSRQMAEFPQNDPKPTLSTVDDRFLSRAIHIVKERMEDSHFGTEDFCNALNMSRSNLHRKLKALTNQSTTEFIRSLRIYRAAELLKKQDVNVSEVAYQVGFESISYFSKSFKEQMGASPSDWISAQNS